MRYDTGVDAIAIDEEAARDAELAASDPKRSRRATQKIKGDGNFFKDIRKQSDYNAK